VSPRVAISWVTICARLSREESGRRRVNKQVCTRACEDLSMYTSAYPS